MISAFACLVTSGVGANGERFDFGAPITLKDMESISFPKELLQSTDLAYRGTGPLFGI